MENETTIYHYGIKGMKWGVRRFQKKATAAVYSHKAKRNRKAAQAAKKDAESIRKNRKQMLTMDVRGRKLFTKKDIDDMIYSLEKQSDRSIRRAEHYESLVKRLLIDYGGIKVKDLN